MTDDGDVSSAMCVRVCVRVGGWVVVAGCVSRGGSTSGSLGGRAHTLVGGGAQ